MKSDQLPLILADSKNASLKLWESIILGLLENFKFNYESLGSGVNPIEAGDIHYSQFYKLIYGYEANPTFFEEKQHVHFNSYFAYGNKTTTYTTNNQPASHHITYENYLFTWAAPIYYFSNWKEMFPLIFSTKNNYFMESCNNYFLKTTRYLNDVPVPISNKIHEKYFSASCFSKNNLPKSLLLTNFNLDSNDVVLPEDTIKTLNFCLSIFKSACSMLFSLQEVFGKTTNQKQQIRYLKKNWAYPKGKLSNKIDLYRLNILSFIYLSMHPAATAICYGLYRTKYGVKNTHRTAFFVTDNGETTSLKDFLIKHILIYIDILNSFSLKHPKQNKIINSKINAALDLARMLGVGYKTNPERGKNYHINNPFNFKPRNLNAKLNKINFIVEHAPTSPLWRIFYDYCGEWWTKADIYKLIRKDQSMLHKLNSSARSFAVYTFHKISAYFWKENISKITLPDNIATHITKTYKEILGS